MLKKIKQNLAIHLTVLSRQDLFYFFKVLFVSLHKYLNYGSRDEPFSKKSTND